MAYLAFPDLGGLATVRHALAEAPGHDVATPGRDRLSALEWSVVAIARADEPPRSRRPGPLSIAIRALFPRPNPPLANARLETLRRIAAAAWQHGDVSPDEVRAFLDAGFTLGQYHTMVDYVGTARSRGRPAPSSSPPAALASGQSLTPVR